MTETNENEPNINVDEVVGEVETHERLEGEAIERKEFDNPVSKYYGVEVDEEIVNMNDFDNLDIVESYPLFEYSYYDEDDNRIDLVEVYILKNQKNNKYFYYLDEPKLASQRAGTDDVDEDIEFSELKWYIRIKSDFDTIVSNIDKDEFESETIEKLQQGSDDLNHVINKIENNEFYWYHLRNKMYEIMYDNILDDVVDMVDSIPEKEDQMYQTIPKETKMKIRYYLQRDYTEYGKISPLMNDPYLEELNCNGSNRPLFVFHGKYDINMMTNIAYDEDELQDTMNMLANESGEQFNERNAQVDGSLPDGSRIQLTSDEIDPNGNNFTIRVFDEVPLTPIDLIDYETFSPEQMVWLWLVVQNGGSGIIAGGTASGKTTTLNALTTFTEPRSKIVTLEDTQELNIHSDNYIQGVTRESTQSIEGYDVDMMALVEAALRQRPDYMFIGEVRGSEANPMFQGMSSGHTAYTTFHADDITEVKNRLINKPISVGPQMLGSLDFVLNQVRLRDGTGRRVLKELREVIDMTEDDELKNDLITKFDYGKREHTQVDWINSETNKEEDRIIPEIRDENDWTTEDLQKEVNNRIELLEYMTENIPRESEEDIEAQLERSIKINQIIRLYMTNPEMTMKLKETGLMLEDDIDEMINLLIASEESANLSNYMKENVDKEKVRNRVEEMYIEEKEERLKELEEEYDNGDIEEEEYRSTKNDIEEEYDNKIKNINKSI